MREISLLEDYFYRGARDGATFKWAAITFQNLAVGQIVLREDMMHTRGLLPITHTPVCGSPNGLLKMN